MARLQGKKTLHQQKDNNILTRVKLLKMLQKARKKFFGVLSNKDCLDNLSAALATPEKDKRSRKAAAAFKLSDKATEMR